jgi:hypothetical protein
MTSFPNSPKLLKGALVGVDPFNPLASLVVFQYNPEKLTRTLTARAAGGQANPGEALRLAGPPEETIRLEVEIDAADQIEKANPLVTTIGTYPTLAAPFSKDWPLLFKSSQTTKTTINPREAVYEQRN